MADTLCLIAAAGFDGYLCVELSWDYTVGPDPAAQKTALRLWDRIGKG